MPRIFRTVRINQNKYKIPITQSKEIEQSPFKCSQCKVSFSKNDDLEDHKNKVNHELINAYRDSLKNPENKTGNIIVILNDTKKIEEVILRENQPLSQCLKIVNNSENDYFIRKISTDRTSSFIEIELISEETILLSKHTVEVNIKLACAIFMAGIEINFQQKDGEDKFIFYKFLVI